MAGWQEDPLAPNNSVADRDKFGSPWWPNDFFHLVRAALYAAQIDPDSLSDWDVAKLAKTLYQDNPYLRSVYKSDEGLPINFLAKAIATTLFNPSVSNNASALQVGIGLLRKYGVPLDKDQQEFTAGTSTKVPLPFDPQFLGNVSLDYQQQWEKGTEVGIDYAMPQGTPLYSPFGGQISVEDHGTSDWGKRVFVTLTNGYKFAIGHMTGFAVTDGQTINPGDLLGFSGGARGDPSSGDSTGEHIEVQWIDPQGNYSDPHQIIDPIFKGTTFDQIGQMAGYGKGPDVSARLLGLDKTLHQKFSPVVKMFESYFGRLPTNSELINLVGTAALQPSTPQAATSPVAPKVPGGRQDIRDLARQAGFPESQLDTAVAIALAESHGDPNAVGKEFGEKGLMQIYGGVHPDLEQKYNLFDPLQNMQAAYELWKAAGGKWTDWSTYTTNDPATGKPWYMAYMGQEATVKSTEGQPNMQQISDSIRGMPSHIPGMNMGQYSDMRASADKVSTDVLGHPATDGVVADLYKEGYTTPAQMKMWYNSQSDKVLAVMDMQTYNKAYKANQPWMRAIYNEQNGMHPATPVHQYPGGTQPGMPNPATGPPPPSREPRRSDEGFIRRELQ